MACIFECCFVVLSLMNTYVNHPFRCFTCTVTLMALLWLTISFAFAYNHSSTHTAQLIVSKENSNKNGNKALPFEKTGEEKAEVTSGDFVSEYVKMDAEQQIPINITINYSRHYTARDFLNFCCDSVSPPPEPAVC